MPVQRSLPNLWPSCPWPLSDALQAAQLDDGGLRAYLQYLQSGLFASFAPPPELESVHRLFTRLALPPEEEGGGSGGAGAGSGAGAAQQQQQNGRRQGQIERGEQLEPQGRQQTQQRQAQQQQEQEPSQAGGAAAYTFYGTAQGKAIRRQLFHADYVALLVACSPMVWLLPESLHEVRRAGWVLQ